MRKTTLFLLLGLIATGIFLVWQRLGQSELCSVTMMANLHPSSAAQSTAAAIHSQAHDSASDQEGLPRAHQSSLPAAPDSLETPHLDQYRHQLTAEHAAALENFRTAFPGVDPTETEAFQKAIIERRASYGLELDPDEASAYADWLRVMESMQSALVRARGEWLGLEISGQTADGRSFLLSGFNAGTPEYTYTQNAAAAESTAVNLVRMNAAHDSLVGDLIGGSGLYVNVNDHGEIYDENPEFQLPEGGTRIVLAEIPTYTGGDRAHMTHVAGTVGAWGYNASVMGMAPRVWIRSHIQQLQSDIYDYGMTYPGQLHTSMNPRTGEQEMKSVIGTTSLGNDDTNTSRGVYTYSASSFDNTLWDAPYYTHFYAAVNDGPDYATLGTTSAVTKNAVIVGSVSDTTRDNDGKYVSGGNISSWSSRGPTFDGRIKPDIVANGESLLSPISATGNGNKSGTSMATPNASGSATLLISYIESRLPGHFFRSSTIKALILNSATDRGETGPDYRYGYGILNIKEAAGIVRGYADNPASATIVEDRLPSGQQWSRTYTSDGSTPIRITLAWIDLGGPGQLATTTDRSPRLVNDLDLRLQAPDGTILLPYVMPFTTGNASFPAFDANLYGAPAVTGDNDTDNVEQILIPAPAPGTYTLMVSHEGTLIGGRQDFSLAMSGLEATPSTALQMDSISPNVGTPANGQLMVLNGAGFHLGTDVYFRRDGSNPVNAYGIQITGSEIICRLDAAEMDPGLYDVVVRSPDGSESVLPSGYLQPCLLSGVRSALYENDFESGAGDIVLDAGWSVADPDKGGVSGPANPFAGNSALVTYPGGNYPNSVNVAATLPVINTLNRSEVQLNVRRWAGFARSGGSRDYGYVQYSLDGTNWTTLVRHENLIETNWTSQTYSLPSTVDNQPAVYIRFTLVTDTRDTSFGWNLDNLSVTALSGIEQPPVIAGEPSGQVTVGTPYSYTFTVTDADTLPAALTTTVTGLPDGIAFTPDGQGGGTISGTPTTPGTAAIRISVADDCYTSWRIFDLIRIPGSGNTPPEWVTTSLPPAVLSSSYAATAAATDPEGHSLRFTVLSKPFWLTVHDNQDGTVSLSGTPTAAALGLNSVALQASDGIDSAIIDLPIMVDPPSRLEWATSAVSISETASEVNLTVRRALNAVGAASVNFRTEATTATTNADFASDSGTLTWTDGDNSDRTVSIMLLDDFLTEGNEQFRLILENVSGMATLGASTATVTLLDNENNAPPNVSVVYPGDAVGIADTLNGILLVGSVSDDGQPFWSHLNLNWEKASGPGIVTFSNTIAEETEATFSEPGTYILRLTVDDGEFSSNAVILIEVGTVPEPAAVIHAPYITNIEVLVSGLDAHLSATFVDASNMPSPTSIATQWSLVSGPGTAVFADPTQADTVVTFDALGEYRLRFQAGDGAATVFMETDCLITSTSGFGSWISSFGLAEQNLPGDDFDQDGVSNLMEYALGGDPSDPAQANRPVYSVEPNDLGSFLTLTFTPQRTDLLFTIESGNDGIGWATTLLSGLTAGQPYKYTDAVPLTPGTVRLVRLKIEEP